MSPKESPPAGMSVRSYRFPVTLAPSPSEASLALRGMAIFLKATVLFWNVSSNLYDLNPITGNSKI
jgi:hypothetical protein